MKQIYHSYAVWGPSAADSPPASVIAAEHQQVKSLRRARVEHTCRQSDPLGRLRAAWQQAPPLEGRLERPVPTRQRAEKPDRQSTSRHANVPTTHATSRRRSLTSALAFQSNL